MVTLPGIICNVRRQNGFQVWEVGVRNRGDPEWANCNSIKQTVAEVDAARALTRRRDVIGSGWIMQIPCRHTRRVHKVYSHCWLEAANLNDVCIRKV